MPSLELLGLLAKKTVLLDVSEENDGPAFRWRYETEAPSEARAVPTSNIVGIQSGTKAYDSVIFLQDGTEDEKPRPADCTITLITFEPGTLADVQFASAFRRSEESFLPQDRLKPTTRPQVIISTRAGTGEAESFFGRVLQPLLAHLGIAEAAYDVHRTTSDQSIVELAKAQVLVRAQNGEHQILLLLSGDGGTIDILNVLFSVKHTAQYLPPDIAVFPLGTGNALANSSVSTNDHTLGLRSLYSGTAQPLPSFKVTFSPGARLLQDEARAEVELQTSNGVPFLHGVVVCSWGFHATLVADSDTMEYRKHGTARFQMAAKEALFPADGSPAHAYRGSVKLVAESEERSDNWLTTGEGEHAYVLLTRVAQLEAGFTISPDSRPLDNRLHLVHFGAMTGEEIMELMQKAYSDGQHVKDPHVTYTALRRLRVDIDEADPHWRRVCIDGSIVRVEAGGWFEVEPDNEPAANLIIAS